MVNIGNEWDGLLADQFKEDYYLSLRQFLKAEYGTRNIFPPMNDIFNALKLTSYSAVKVVILGQDPYHEVGQAHGLCFSVKAGTKLPPSLVNIYKELSADMGVEVDFTKGDLTRWAQNGVLLLNTALTVREGAAASHRGKGWEKLTDRIIELLGRREAPIVFMLWGNHARQKKSLIKSDRHLVLECAHPSPLSAYNGFFGCKHFSKAKKFLNEHNQDIDWSVL